MVDSDSELALDNYYKGLSTHYELAGAEKASVRWIDHWCCTSVPSVTRKDDNNASTEISEEDWSNWIDEESGALEHKELDRS